MRLKNKLAVITAAGAGMGRCGVLKFIEEGATVAAVDFDQEKLDALVEETKGKVKPILADLTDPERCKSFVDDAAKALGGIDLLWNHAGSPVDGEIEKLDMGEYDRTTMLNLTSAVLGTSAAIEHIRKRGGGSILFTASVAGLVGSHGSPIYSAQKFGIVGYTMSLAQRLAPDKIRVNVVCPGIVDTAMLSGFFEKHTNSTPEEYEAGVRAATPMGRFGEPHEIANAAAFLLSDEASFITGVALPVDGGYTCR